MENITVVREAEFKKSHNVRDGAPDIWAAQRGATHTMKMFLDKSCGKSGLLSICFESLKVEKLEVKFWKIKKTMNLECCHAMIEAQEEGSDSEAYHPLIKYYGYNQGFVMGAGLPNLKFCPWCGKAIPEE